MENYHKELATKLWNNSIVKKVFIIRKNFFIVPYQEMIHIETAIDSYPNDKLYIESLLCEVIGKSSLYEMYLVYQD